MSNFVRAVTDLTIAIAATATRWVDSTLETADASKISITFPAAVDAGTYVIQTSFDGVTVHGTLNTGSADVALPAVGKTVQYDNIIAPYWRISGPAAAAERTIRVAKLCNPY